MKNLTTKFFNHKELILSDKLTPEERLGVSILERAARDAVFSYYIKVRYRRVKKKPNEALEWIQSSDRAPWTFLWWCEQLDINAEKFLRYIEIGAGVREGDAPKPQPKGLRAKKAKISDDCPTAA